jgi:aminoglycoside/choline kinase family phosphotransferase
VLFGHNARMIESAGDSSVIQQKRQQAAAAWAAAELGLGQVELRPVSGDASFRRYFRLAVPGRTLILMDAPPDREDSEPFVDIAQRLRAAGLRAPEIHCFDLQHGFGLLEDFGDTLYRDVLNEGTVDSLFPGLFAILEGMALRVDTRGLPHYGERLLQTELDLFPDWYLECHRKRPLDSNERLLWSEMCRSLIESAHVSYDFVSLLWDRYIAWPRERLAEWMEEIRPRLAPGMEREEWMRCCDWMGLQRNLKIVGIFARLNYRDGKQGYLEMIPRFYQYLLDILPRYPEFRSMRHLLEGPECAP